MTREKIKAIRQLTIESAKQTFESDYGEYDKEDDDYVREKEKLESYCEGVEDVLRILSNSCEVEE
jgi:hypothetical protein